MAIAQSITQIRNAGVAVLLDGDLSGELDEAVRSLAAFDATRLEAVEQRLRTATVARLASAREQLPEIVAKHAVLGQLLAATAANLKVLVSVLHLEPRSESRMETR